jgi:hypothetical protein
VQRSWAAEIAVEALTSGAWSSDLDDLLARPRPRLPANDLAVRAAAVLDEQLDLVLD